MKTSAYSLRIRVLIMLLLWMKKIKKRKISNFRLMFKHSLRLSYGVHMGIVRAIFLKLLHIYIEEKERIIKADIR